MIYVVLISLGVLWGQFRLARHPIAGLIVPLSCTMGTLAAGLSLMQAGSWQEPMNRIALLTFLLLTTASFLLYFRQRRKEYREGYINDEKPKKPPGDEHID